MLITTDSNRLLLTVLCNIQYHSISIEQHPLLPITIDEECDSLIHSLTHSCFFILSENQELILVVGVLPCGCKMLYRKLDARLSLLHNVATSQRILYQL